MKYKKHIDFPKAGDKVITSRGTEYTITRTSTDKFEQGDLVTGYEKGIHCFIGMGKKRIGNIYVEGETPIILKVYTDSLKPIKGKYTDPYGAYVKPAEEFINKKKEECTDILERMIEIIF